MADFLKDIVEHKRAQLEGKRAVFAGLKESLQTTEMPRYQIFKKVIDKPGPAKLIAEVKKASPSKGIIRKDFNAPKIAATYVQNGAVAVSVLTEEKYFLGKPEYLKAIAEQFRVPVLMKDFIIDEVQILEAFYHKASAILLIAAILTDEQLKSFLLEAANLDIDCLVEVHDEKELDRALKAGAEIIGVNNRNLHTFEVDLNVSRTLIPKIPVDKVAVTESGYRTKEEIAEMSELGAHAVLIGETLMCADDIPAKIKELGFGAR